VAALLARFVHRAVLIDPVAGDVWVADEPVRVVLVTIVVGSAGRKKPSGIAVPRCDGTVRAGVAILVALGAMPAEVAVAVVVVAAQLRLFAAVRVAGRPTALGTDDGMLAAALNAIGSRLPVTHSQPSFAEPLQS
jgi:hypothetical protein